jgi:hypothetical protein
MINSEIVRRVAMGDIEAIEEVKKLPVPLRMSYGAAADELRRQENIVPMENGMSLYVQPKTQITSNEGVGESLRRMLEEKKAKEAEIEKQRQEHAEKVAKQAAERAKLGLRQY